MKRILLAGLLASLALPLTAANDAANKLVAAAHAVRETGDTKTAVKLMKQAIAADPTDATLQTDYANLLTVRINEVNFMVKGAIAGKMLSAYRKSVELDPYHVVGWIGLCRYYLNAPAIAGGSVDKAETYAKEVFAILPSQGEVEFALIAEKRGDLAAAAEHFRTALSVRPDHGEALAGLSRVGADQVRITRSRGSIPCLTAVASHSMRPHQSSGTAPT